jgi:hypothetical protein
MASAGQGHLSKKERRGLHPDRRDKIAGLRKKEDGEDTLVNEDEGMSMKDDIPVVKEDVAAVKVDVIAAKDDIAAIKSDFAVAGNITLAKEAAA